jgi:hypothetical protein
VAACLPFPREKLIIGVLISRRELFGSVCEQLTTRWGEIDYTSPFLPFDYTHYYDREMGGSIERVFLSFGALLAPDLLPAVKRATNRIELLFAADGLRPVNLDPGLLNSSRLVLATTKDGSHRVPLSGGIYAEVTLTYEKGKFRALPWTYPDFRSERYGQILSTIRERYRRQRSR